MEAIQQSVVTTAASQMHNTRLSVIDDGKGMSVDSKDATECGIFTVIRGRAVKLVLKVKVTPECAACETVKDPFILLII